ncbi:MAG: extracellular solute-binding protein [Agathobacter sp.]|nr:extracellular solute-binding protein [Agathobacter sp.]
MVKKIFSYLYMALIFLFLYLPILILIVLSFNNSKSKVTWGGFTFDWYKNCFQNESIMNAFATTIEITLLSAIISTIIGTCAAIGINSMRRKKQAIYLAATNIPLLNADIVTGISMMLLFVKFIDLGFVTVLIAHITFSIPYVILNILPKLKQLNRYTYEAALDLGASPLYAFCKITWPQIRSGVFSGFLMAVTMSLDDFSITYFTKGAGVNTLSTMLYTELKKGVKPELYALSTILFFTVLLLLLIANVKPQKPVQTPKYKITRHHIFYYASKIVTSVVVIALVIGSASIIYIQTNNQKSTQTLTILNYGKYYDDKALSDFEKETGINIKYEEYEDPEEMYTKYKAGAIDYDIICTSDYIIEKLISENEVLPMDYNAIENYDNVETKIIDMSESFDPEHKYTIPYFYGTLGLLYNTKTVDSKDVNSWDCLWSNKYSQDMIMINSVRDAFSPALISSGFSINETDEKRLNTAVNLLSKQSKNVIAYYVDETCDEMIAENASIAVCYSGEAATAMSVNPDLEYSVPKEGSNLWIDSWFIPKTCKNPELAYKFLNYTCSDKVGKANFEYVYYASPLKSVNLSMDDALKNNTAINPSDDIIKRCEVYKALSDEKTTLYSNLWQKLKI